MNRRTFINQMSTGVAGVLAASTIARGRSEDIDARRIPRWRGFNLQGWFGTPEKPNTGQAFDELDFATIAEWGFNFARLPLSYWTWGKKDDWSYLNEDVLKKIDYAATLAVSTAFM